VTDEISIDVPTNHDWDAIYRLISIAFNEDGDEAASAAERMAFEPERFLVARRAGEVVGTAGICTRRMAVPGAVVPTAHVTFVAVTPTARRQGVLTRFMRQQFEDVRAAGEPIAALWASEGRIYQRFGYGLAARKLSLNVETREVDFTVNTPDHGRLRDGTPEDLRDAIAKLYEEVYPQRPGWSERASQHLDFRIADLERSRRGATSLRAVIHETEHGVDGYALWRVAENWGDSGPAGEVRILELVSATNEAYAALWRFLLTVDLTRSTSAWSAAVDEPLLFMVNEPRRLNAKLADALWLRIVDVPGALAARRYATDVNVVIDVTDDRIPTNTGRWRLIGTADSAHSESTVDEPDLACDIRALGAAYLGGTSLDALARAGRVREVRPGTLATASVAFGWHRVPSAIEVF
jgi:predicted acetyltransferase